MTAPGPRIALVHALEESVAPARAALVAHWPQARPFDLLDTSLAPDLAVAGLDQTIYRRIAMLFDYASDAGGPSDPTQAVLFTCSAFAPAIAVVQTGAKIPVLTPNVAAFREALAVGPRVGVAVTFGPSAAALLDEIREVALVSGVEVRPRAILVPAALEALRGGDTAAHDRHIVDALAKVRDVDAVVLGQFSMARALPSVQTQLTAPVITTPDTAVKALKSLYEVRNPS